MTASTIEESYELSPMQQGMLVDSLAGREPGVDIVQIVCHLDEEMEVAPLARAWSRVVGRHPILRTAFRFEASGEPAQDVYAEVALPFEGLDWRGVPERDVAERWRSFIEADRLRGFDLFRPPLLRLALVTLGDREHRLLWSFHHALLDGRVLPSLLREAFAFYDAAVEGRDLDLPLPRPYADYIRWLRTLDWDGAQTYWRAALRGFCAPTPIGVQRFAPDGEQGGVGLGVDQVLLPPDVTSRLGTFAREQGVTLNTLVHGAWALLLHHYSGEPEVVFGAVRTLRRSTVEGAEQMIGPLINTLPVRVAVDPGASLAPWLRALRAGQAGIREHEHTPLAQVHAWSELPPGTPLFESLVAFDHGTVDTMVRAFGGRWARRRCEHITKTRFPLSLSVYGGEPELRLELRHYRRLLDDEAAGRMLGHFRRLLEAMPAHGEAPLGTLPMLARPERSQIVEEWNRTDRPYPRERCLHELIEAQVARTPERVAVEADEGRLSYRELDDRANHLARFLRERGVGPGGLVGVAMERSLDMVVGFLGILKAGGAYVPLDPGYPPDRLRFMVEDARVPLLLTQERLLPSLPVHATRAVALDSGWPEIAREGAEVSRPVVTSHSLAYVIFTSGSTGRPKGAMNEHRGIVNRLLWMQDEYPLEAGDAVLHKAPISFDVSIWELFWPLLAGARVVMARPEGHKDPAYLVRTIRERGITTVQFVPAMLQAFLREPGVEQCVCLRRVFSGGEALSGELRDRFFESLGCELHNLYGPTETAVAVTFQACQRDERQQGVPIGRPLANTRIYVLDSRLEPVPVGVAGELHIGGIQVGRGYLGRPELTAERFVPDPFAADGARLYRTGDLARLRPDGAVEYLGRMDHQVKVRGLRIELGEIETALEHHAGVRQAVVVAPGYGSGGVRLVGYVVGEAGLSASDLRAHLGKTLPDFMVPTTFVFLDAFSLTPSGKVDRKALSAPEGTIVRDEGYVAPRTATEETLSRIWKEVLGVERVGAEDDFFVLGGHSLLATQVMSRVRKTLGVELPLRELFAATTVSKLAEAIDLERAQRSEGGPRPAGPILRISRTAPAAAAVKKGQQ